MSGVEFTVSPRPHVPVTPLIVAHRGASAHAPENTFAAFRKAIESGAEGVEFDVRLSKDGVPVVIHDDTLTRTAGINRGVTDLTADRLASLDVGSWFNAAYPSKARPEFAAEGVPSLRSVLELLERVGGPVYIEVKCEPAEDVSALVDAVCSEIAASPLLKQIIVGSFCLGVLPRARAVLPGVQTAALFAPKFMRFLRKEKYLINLAREVGADHLSLHRSLISRKLVRKAESYGLPVTVWTVNNHRAVVRAAKNGLYAVITDDPSKLLAGRKSMPRRQSQGGTSTQKPFRAGSPPVE